MPAGELRSLVSALLPKAWDSDRSALVQALQQSRMPEQAETVWLTDGLQDGESAEAAYTLAEWLLRLGPLSVIAPPAEDAALALLPPVTDAQGDTVIARRPAGINTARQVTLRATTDQGES